MTGRLVTLPAMTAEELAVLRDALHSLSDNVSGPSGSAPTHREGREHYNLIRSLQTAVAEALMTAERETEQ